MWNVRHRDTGAAEAATEAAVNAAGTAAAGVDAFGHQICQSAGCVRLALSVAVASERRERLDAARRRNGLPVHRLAL